MQKKIGKTPRGVNTIARHCMYASYSKQNAMINMIQHLACNGHSCQCDISNADTLSTVALLVFQKKAILYINLPLLLCN